MEVIIFYVRILFSIIWRIDKYLARQRKNLFCKDFRHFRKENRQIFT